MQKGANHDSHLSQDSTLIAWHTRDDLKDWSWDDDLGAPG